MHRISICVALDESTRVHLLAFPQHALIKKWRFKWLEQSGFQLQRERSLSFSTSVFPSLLPPLLSLPSALCIFIYFSLKDPEVFRI